MPKTVTIGVRVPPETEKRIQQMAERMSGVVQVTASQVLRAAIDAGLDQLEKKLKKGEDDARR